MTDIKEESVLNSDEEYWENVDVNDCGYLLRTLEREAFTAVVNALRAKGPPSEHTFLLLNHLKSALSINDELGRAEIRRAAFDPKLCKLSNVLNPNYDTSTEWSGCSSVSRGFVEARPSRGKPFAMTSSCSIADQLLDQATARNEKINRSTGRAVELLALPHKPFVPERLRLLLRETDRAEERVVSPLESTSRRSVPLSADRSRSECRPPPVKKRRQRRSKGKEKEEKEKEKEKETPPELKAEKSPKREDESSVPSVPLDTPSTSAAGLVTPSAAAAISSTVDGGAASVIISPGQPPQSGDAMKTWVSKIHEAEVAASAAKKNGSVLSPVDLCEPSTSFSSTDESAKKKRRPRAPAQDPYLANSCARTRPFRFENEDKNGKPRLQRGNPDFRSSSAFGAGVNLPSALTGASPAACSSSTPIARPQMIDSLTGHGLRNGLLDDLHASTSSLYGSGGMKPSAPTSAQVKKGIGISNLTRAPGRYYVNNSGGSVASSPSAMKSTGLTGRTGSLGSQHLSYPGVIPGVPLLTHKATASNSSSSMCSTGGGSTSSGIGTSSSCTSVLSGDSSSVHPLTAPPPEVAGHDYTFTAASQSRIDSLFELRQPLKVASRVPRLTNTPLRSPSLTTSPQHLSYLNGLSSSVPLYATSSLQRAGTMSTFRPRAGSRGAVPAAAAAAVAPTGERLGPTVNEPVTDGMVQEKVHNIMLEAAQKECANGKRSTTMLMRENGLLNRHSPVPASSSQPVQQQQSYAVCRPSTSYDGIAAAAAAPSSTMSEVTRVQQPVDPPLSKTPVLVAPTGIPSVSLATATPFQTPSSSLYPSHPTTSIGAGMGSSSLFGGPSTSSSPSLPSLLHPLIPSDLNEDSLRQFLQSSDPASQQLIHSAFSNLIAISTIVPDASTQQQQQPSTAAAAAARIVATPSPATAPPRPTQRQYMLQPEGMNFAEFNIDNAHSYKSFSSEGTSVQFVVPREELYDQGVLPRPSTSGMTGGGGSAETSMTHQPQASSDSYLMQQMQKAVASAAALGVPSSFSIPSTTETAGHDNGQMPLGSRDERSQLQPLSEEETPRVENTTSSEVKDILEQSCKELQ